MVKKTAAKKVIKKLTKKTKPKTRGEKSLKKAIEAERKKDLSFDDKVSYYNYLAIEKNITDPKKIAEKMKAFVPGKPIKMKAGGIALRGHGKAFLKGNR
tara:strand:+ start:455 stop:751 length:297 start_codon:yes stop_codon:yes gene_type:complete